jgi:hypothetical protein
MVVELLAFLNARLDEQERNSRECYGQECWCGYGDLDHAYIAADVEAKRKLIDALFGPMATIDHEWGCSHTPDQIKAGQCGSTSSDLEGLYLLAAPFAGHPDYQKKWAT